MGTEPDGPCDFMGIKVPFEMSLSAWTSVEGACDVGKSKLESESGRTRNLLEGVRLGSISMKEASSNETLNEQFGLGRVEIRFGFGFEFGFGFDNQVGCEASMDFEWK